jgi:predicted dehydrogenase
LIATRDRTGRTLMVAFQGTLSPRGGEARRLLHSGELGPVLNISAVVWQDWATNTAGTWRQQPDASGGGFLFDTGAHMLNTVTDLAGEDFTEVAAWQADDGYPVDIRSVVMGRLGSGALVTMNACGRAIPSCNSDVRFFTAGAILRTGIYGELLELQRAGRTRLRTVPVDGPTSVWGTYLDVRAGRLANPNPPEVGLRMARLWDAIRLSARNGGAVVTLGSAVPIRAADGVLPNPSLTVAAS